MIEQGRGTVRKVKAGGKIVGYQALLPRELSRRPPGASANYQQPVGPRQPTEEAARRLLDAAIVERRQGTAFRQGLPLSHYVEHAIRADEHEARRVYGRSHGSRSVATWRSIQRRWLPEAEFVDWPPAAIETADAQRFFDWLTGEAEGRFGDPLSGSFVRTIGRLLRAAFARAGAGPNAMDHVRLPPKGAPRIAYLGLPVQRVLFGAADDAVPFSDRLMVGCGMGPGLRVGELLAMEADDAHVDDRDPHLVVRYGGPGRAPTKGRRVRRVELYEPGLGFWRLWLERCYAGGRLVFAGPSGGYRKAWPDQFAGWARALELDRLTSHVMRHSFAVAMLSGTWGYDPMSLEFVSQQLGHADRATTERYYGAFERGTWTREVRRMTGRTDLHAVRRVVTAAELLGLEGSGQAGAQEDGAASAAHGLDARADARPLVFSEETPISFQFPSSTQSHKNIDGNPRADASTHQFLAEQAREALRLIEAGDSFAFARAIEVLRQAAALDDEAHESREVDHA